jgi:hypothetical protein
MWRLPALAGAALMPGSLFLDWFKVPPGIFTESAFTLDGWTVFESTDAVMVLVAVTTLFLVTTAPPYAGRALICAGAVATSFVTVAVVDKPNFYALPSLPVSREIGAWIGLLGAVLVLAAGVLSFAAADRNAST